MAQAMHRDGCFEWVSSCREHTPNSDGSLWCAIAEAHQEATRSTRRPTEVGSAGMAEPKATADVAIQRLRFHRCGEACLQRCLLGGKHGGSQRHDSDSA